MKVTNHRLLQISRGELSETIGKVARRARTALGWTQDDAAEQVGVSSYFYACIERGTKSPSVETFAKMVDCLQISASALLGEEEPDLPEPQPRPRRFKPDSSEWRSLLRRMRRADMRAYQVVEQMLDGLEQFRNTSALEPETIYSDASLREPED